ncbi:MAG: PEP-CTERM sorting domain-containing protein [Verrucomicrobiales bacterium]
MHKSPCLTALAAALAFAAPPSAHAAITIQELFDGMALDTTINGQGGSATSIGLSGTWAVNSGDTIYTANNFNVQPLPGLSPQGGDLGGVWKGGGGDWSTAIWATRPLTSPVDFSIDSTVYFSVRLNNTGDTATGFGFSSGSAAASEFAGVGTHWDNHTDLNSAEARNSLYSTWGTLDQDLAGNNDGPYAMRAHTAEGSVNGRALVVGRLTTSAGGSDSLDLKLYFDGDTIDNNLGTIAWSLSDSFASSMSASHLLIWANGNGNGELDAIRVGQTWEDVTGVALVPEPASGMLTLLGSLALLRRRRRC